jgi:integrase
VTLKRHKIVGDWVVRTPFRSGGYYVCRCRSLVTGRTHKVTTRETQIAKAERFACKWAQEHSAEPSASPKLLSLRDALTEWLGTKAVRDVTLRGYALDCELYSRAFEHQLASEVAYPDIQQFLSKLTKAGKSARTRAKHLVALRSFFRWAKRCGYRPDDPTDGLSVRRGDRRQRTALTVDELKRLLRACFEPHVVQVEGVRRRGSWTQTYRPPTHLGIAVAIAVYTALRRRNVFQLRWAQTDLAAGKISFDGADMKAGAPLDLPIHSALAQLLRRTIRLRGRVAPNDLVVGEEVAACGTALRSACRRAGIPQVGWHDLRRSTGTLLSVSPACSYSCLKDLLGHARRNPTDLYALTPWEAKRRAIESLPPDLIPREAIESRLQEINA